MVELECSCYDDDFNICTLNPKTCPGRKGIYYLNCEYGGDASKCEAAIDLCLEIPEHDEDE